MASSEQSIITNTNETNPSTGNQESAEIDYGTKIINLVAEINDKDAAFRESINHVGTIDREVLKNCMKRAYEELSIINWMYSHKTAICNQLTDIISKCVKQHLGAANSEEPPEVNVKFMFDGLRISYMYVLNDSTIIIPIHAMADMCKINIYYPYREIGYHNSYEYKQCSRTPLCIYTSNDGLSAQQQKKITGEILKCLNNPPQAN